MSDPESSPAHRLLARMEGTWEGTARTWYEPGKLADTSPIKGTVRPVLGGRFFLHEYEGALSGARMVGWALFGHDLARKVTTMAWVDTYHMGTGTMLSEGGPPGEDALGSYADPSGGPDWGWRTRVEVRGPDDLVLTHFNITPNGEEAPAVEIVTRRAEP